MISFRTKCLIGGAFLAPLSLAAILSAEFYLLHQTQTGRITPQQAVQEMVPWSPKLFLLLGLGGLFAVAALISLVLDNRHRQ